MNIPKSITFKLILWHASIFCLGFIIFIMLFRSSIHDHMILFYRGLLLISYTGLFISLVFVLVKRLLHSNILTWRDLVISVILVMSFCSLYFTHLPVTADRSVSVFILSFIGQENRSYSKDDISNALIENYIRENDSVGKRIEEQIATGTIHEVDGEYFLTKKGRDVIEHYEFVSELFGLEDKSNLN